ncbi:MAG TPA: DEAD/DEAH box helicase [Alphaproteobacteria bacterium]|nr:ATP-dependent RNA helicase [Rhodospirillaceae bacterium]HRJ12857.1 DEAD/DEAH box helicase [Alphaproteobacteria bacterium]
MTQRQTAAVAAHTSFEAFGLPEKLLKSLNRMNFTTPTPIQSATIPLAMEGNDVLGTAQTGTGKTAAFGIPAICYLMEHDDAMALIMTPTRELAAQVIEAMQQMIPVPNIKTALLIGGEAIPRQLRQLDAKPRLIVGTPGRINDHLVRRSLKLQNAGFLVLDETDRMLDMGFGPQIETIVEKMNDKRQTLLFSATLPDNITKLSKKYLTNPKRIAVGSLTTPIANIKQETMRVTDEGKYDQLMMELEQRKGSIIIFVKTKHGADRLAKKLSNEEMRAAAIHGDLQQRKRDRVIADFREKKFRILVATDVAARGLDIPHIEHVINYDLPQVPEDYIHRIGRTARAGALGSAVNFVTHADGRKWVAIQRLLGGNTDTQDPRASRGVKRHGDDRARGALPKRAGKPGGGFGKKFGGPRSGDDYAPRKRSNDDYTPRARVNNDDRPQRSERKEWSPVAERAEFVEARPARTERSERPKSGGRTAQQRNERPARGFRGDRPAERSARPAGERPARPAHTDRSYGERPKKHDDRPAARTERPEGVKPKKHGGPKNRWSSARKEHAKSGRGRDGGHSAPKKFSGPKKRAG